MESVFIVLLVLYIFMQRAALISERKLMNEQYTAAQERESRLAARFRETDERCHQWHSMFEKSYAINGALIKAALEGLVARSALDTAQDQYTDLTQQLIQIQARGRDDNSR